MLHRIFNTKSATIFIWHITETAAELALLLTPFHELANIGLDSYQQSKLWHNTHFLSTRLLLFKYAGLLSPVLKNEFGKPFTQGKLISITHSNNYAAIIISDKAHVAIDLEKIDDRILRVAHKFINDKEKFFHEEETVIYNTLIWSAKETLYKFYSANEVIFKDELLVHPFEYKGEGTFIGDILKNPTTLNIEIRYTTFNNYVLCWCED